MEPAPQETTKHLIERARAGSDVDFEKLYVRLAPAIYAWAKFRIHEQSRCWIPPEDLVQEVWYRSWRALDTFDPSRSFRSWVFGVAKKVLLEGYRQAERSRIDHPKSDGRQTVLTLNDYPESVLSVSRQAIRNETIERFLQQIAILGQTDQRLVLCCGLEGLNTEEAARRLGLSHAAAQKRWQRLRQRIAELPGLARLLAEDDL